MVWGNVTDEGARTVIEEQCPEQELRFEENITRWDTWNQRTHGFHEEAKYLDPVKRIGRWLIDPLAFDWNLEVVENSKQIFWMGVGRWNHWNKGWAGKHTNGFLQKQMVMFTIKEPKEVLRLKKHSAELCHVTAVLFGGGGWQSPRVATAILGACSQTDILSAGVLVKLYAWISVGRNFFPHRDTWKTCWRSVPDGCSLVDTFWSKYIKPRKLCDESLLKWFPELNRILPCSWNRRLTERGRKYPYVIAYFIPTPGAQENGPEYLMGLTRWRPAQKIAIVCLCLRKYWAG